MDSQILAPVLENFAPTTIVHAAYSSSVNLSMARPLADFRRSVAGVYEVLEAARLALPTSPYLVPLERRCLWRPRNFADH
jgi:UDP-glucose 4-epimerase